jgi:hypothetical protein
MDIGITTNLGSSKYQTGQARWQEISTSSTSLGTTTKCAELFRAIFDAAKTTSRAPSMDSSASARQSVPSAFSQAPPAEALADSVAMTVAGAAGTTGPLQQLPSLRQASFRSARTESEAEIELSIEPPRLSPRERLTISIARLDAYTKFMRSGRVDCEEATVKSFEDRVKQLRSVATIPNLSKALSLLQEVKVATQSAIQRKYPKSDKDLPQIRACLLINLVEGLVGSASKVTRSDPSLSRKILDEAKKELDYLLSIEELPQEIAELRIQAQQNYQNIMRDLHQPADSSITLPVEASPSSLPVSKLTESDSQKLFLEGCKGQQLYPRFSISDSSVSTSEGVLLARVQSYNQQLADIEAQFRAAQTSKIKQELTNKYWQVYRERGAAIDESFSKLLPDAPPPVLFARALAARDILALEYLLHCPDPLHVTTQFPEGSLDTTLASLYRCVQKLGSQCGLIGSAEDTASSRQPIGKRLLSAIYQQNFDTFRAIMAEKVTGEVIASGLSNDEKTETIWALYNFVRNVSFHLAARDAKEGEHFFKLSLNITALV